MTPDENKMMSSHFRIGVQLPPSKETILKTCARQASIGLGSTMTMMLGEHGQILDDET